MKGEHCVVGGFLIFHDPCGGTKGFQIEHWELSLFPGYDLVAFPIFLPVLRNYHFLVLDGNVRPNR